MINYRILTDLDEIKKELAGTEPVAFDFETAPDDPYREEPRAALDAHKAHIVGCSFSTKESDAFYVPVAHRAGKNTPDSEAFWQIARCAVFMNPHRVKIAHNLAFEAMFLYKMGIIVQEPCYDTIAASQLTLKAQMEFRNLHDSGLKLLATQLFQADMPSFEAVTGGRHFDKMDPDAWETTRYACADSDYTLRLYYKFHTWFDRYLPSHRWITEHLESPTAVYVGMMKYNGILMDQPMMASKQSLCEENIAKYCKKIDTLTGGIGIGSNASTKAFRDWLYATQKIPVLNRTEKGMPAMDDEAMILLKEWCEKNKPELTDLFDNVIEYRKWAKLKTTYLDGYTRAINPVTGRIHPDLMPLKTATGRFACSNPNLQNQVAAGDDPIGVRNFMIAPEGWSLLECDYSQAEIRLVAYLSQDQVLLDAYRHGEDVHAITTSAVYRIPLEEAKDKSRPDYKHRRTVAKGTMFGIMYGIAGKGLSRNLHTNAGVVVTPEECNSYIDGILDKYSAMASWQIETKRSAYNNMFVETALGRRRYLPNIRSRDRGLKISAERMSINTPVQGLGADCLKLSMATLVAALKDKDYIRPVLTVHDSLVFEVRDDRIEEATAIVLECMQFPPPLPNFMPLIAEAAHGKRYGQLRE